MPVEEKLVLRITCDNPECPGNELDPTDRTGWIFLSSETYGQAVNPQQVYCSPECAAHISTALTPPTVEPSEEATAVVPPDPKPA